MIEVSINLEARVCVAISRMLAAVDRDFRHIFVKGSTGDFKIWPPTVCRPFGEGCGGVAHPETIRRIGNAFLGVRNGRCSQVQLHFVSHDDELRARLLLTRFINSLLLPVAQICRNLAA